MNVQELRRFCNDHKDPAWRGRLTEYDKGYSDCCIAVLEMIEAQEKDKDALCHHQWVDGLDGGTLVCANRCGAWK